LVFVAVIVVAYMIVVLRDSVQYRAMHFDIPSVSVSVCMSVCLSVSSLFYSKNPHSVTISLCHV